MLIPPRNKVIHKYDLGPEPGKPSKITLDPNAKLIHFSTQDRVFKLWALVDPKCSTPMQREFIVLGTGDEFDSNVWNYLKTFNTDNYVWHLFAKSPFLKAA